MHGQQSGIREATEPEVTQFLAEHANVVDRVSRAFDEWSRDEVEPRFFRTDEHLRRAASEMRTALQHFVGAPDATNEDPQHPETEADEAGEGGETPTGFVPERQTPPSSTEGDD